MSEIEYHCSVLGLAGSISARDLRSAYRKCMLEWHPDLHQGNADRERIAHTKAVAINHAFEYLFALLEHSDPIILSVRSSASATPQSRSQPQPTSSYTGQGFPDPSVLEVFVKSSNIYSIGYNRSNQVLYIKFLRKNEVGVDIYRYFEVPESVFRAFLAAESKGRFAHRTIYSKYRYERAESV